MKVSVTRALRRRRVKRAFSRLIAKFLAANEHSVEWRLELFSDKPYSLQNSKIQVTGNTTMTTESSQPFAILQSLFNGWTCITCAQTRHKQLTHRTCQLC